MEKHSGHLKRLPLEVIRLIIRSCGLATLRNTALSSRSFFYESLPVLWEVIPTAQALLGLLDENIPPGPDISGASRWWTYAKWVVELDVGLISLGDNQYQWLATTAIRRQLLPALQRMYIYSPGPVHSYVALTEKRNRGKQPYWQAPREPNWTDAGAFGVIAVSEALHTLSYAYTSGHFPNFVRILERAPSLRTFRISQVSDKVGRLWLGHQVLPFRGCQYAMKQLGLDGQGSHLGIPASVEKLASFYAIHSLHIAGEVIGFMDLAAVGFLPSLHSLVLDGCPYHGLTPWSSGAGQVAFRSLRKLQFLGTDIELVALSFQLNGILESLHSFSWDLAVTGSHWEMVMEDEIITEREIYADLVRKLRIRASELVVLEIMLYSTGDTTGWLEELELLTLSRWPDLVRIPTHACDTLQWSTGR